VPHTVRLPKENRRVYVSKQQRYENGSPITILLQIEGEEGPKTENARCWATAVLDQGTKRSRRPTERRWRRSEQREVVH